MTQERRLSEKYDTARPRSETGEGWRVSAPPVDPLFSLRAPTIRRRKLFLQSIQLDRARNLRWQKSVVSHFGLDASVLRFSRTFIDNVGREERLAQGIAE
jgi:hypothetical protein